MTFRFFFYEFPSSLINSTLSSPFPLSLPLTLPSPLAPLFPFLFPCTLHPLRSFKISHLPIILEFYFPPPPPRSLFLFFILSSSFPFPHSLFHYFPFLIILSYSFFLPLAHRLPHYIVFIPVFLIISSSLLSPFPTPFSSLSHLHQFRFISP